MSYFRKIASRMANFKLDGALKPAVTPDSIPQPMNGSVIHPDLKQPNAPISHVAKQPQTTRLAADKDQENATESTEKQIVKLEIPVPDAPKQIDSAPAAADQSQAMPAAMPDNNLVKPDIAKDAPIEHDKPVADPLSVSSLDKNIRPVDLAADHQNTPRVSAANHSFSAKPTEDSSPSIPVPKEGTEHEQSVSAELESKFSPRQKDAQPNPAIQLRPATPSDGGAKYSPSSLEPKEETVVAINIGRIEVRTAVSPSDPKPFARKEYAPSLSLAEYLKKRSAEVKTYE
jgi:hypothetical protein